MDVDIEPLFFDTGFFELANVVEDTSRLILKLVPGPIYLTLFNYHNGYYSHGFEAFGKTGDL